MPESTTRAVDLIQSCATELNPDQPDYTPLIRRLADASFVLLGEATHGTEDFYRARATISKRLILEHGLNAIAIEGDWPSAYRVNQYIRGRGADENADQALSGFERFPLWMWRNTVMLDFVEWLREHNRQVPVERQVGFYGLDMYSMHESIGEVIRFLEKEDVELAREARIRYGCLDQTGGVRNYGLSVRVGRRPSCEEEVVSQLLALRERTQSAIREGDWESADERFHAERNARLVESAEAYYRQMFDDDINTWNLRDSHMVDTLANVHAFLSERLGHKAKIAVWEHNSHLGDARATDMGAEDQHNVGQLVRERYGDDCALVGFTTAAGTVTAASEWDGPAEHKTLVPALTGSVEDLLHRTGLRHFYLPLRGEVVPPLREPRLQRAVGVLYLPRTERYSHYFLARLADQFDAVIHVDQSRALEPLDPTSEWVRDEPQTYPFGV